MNCPMDPFKKYRQAKGVLPTKFDNEPTPMLLKSKDVRDAAKDWPTFTSDTPFRVPIPSEENVRSVRQLPIETDPPQHTEYRKLVEPFFRRPAKPEFKEKIERLVGELLCKAAQAENAEIVREFALPLQSRALTYLLNVPEEEAEEWISWGTHVFRDGEDGESKGAALERYIHKQFDRAAENPGDDFFSALAQAKFQGRPLTREEMVGFANLTFAGGRDTVINTVSSIIAFVAEDPKLLERLKADQKSVMTASEEFVRVVSPLTHIGRTCAKDAAVQGHAIPKGQRVSLCWASANYDETVFEAPEELRIDRKPNPHVAYGSGPHNCLGALHARLIVRTLLSQLCQFVEKIEIIEAVDNVEREEDYERKVGYERLVAKVILKANQRQA